MSLRINFAEPKISICNSKLKSVGNITLDSVNNMSKNLRQYLRDCSPIRLKELAQMNCYAASKIKNGLDEQYGKNNYILIAIGRSLSSIAELIGIMGVDTKIIPMSGLRRYDIDNIPQDGLSIYKTFLTKIGLSRETLEKNKNKTFVLMDYTNYGTSLEKAEQLLKRQDMLGNAPNLVAIPVSKPLGDDYTRMGYERLFECCRFKDYSCVERLPVYELEKVYERCIPDRIKKFSGNITQGLRKLFWFNVFDSFLEQNYTNSRPQKEIEALYKHHYSQKAIRNYIMLMQNRKQNLMNVLLGMR